MSPVTCCLPSLFDAPGVHLCGGPSVNDKDADTNYQAFNQELLTQSHRLLVLNLLFSLFLPLYCSDFSQRQTAIGIAVPCDALHSLTFRRMILTATFAEACDQRDATLSPTWGASSCHKFGSFLYDASTASTCLQRQRSSSPITGCWDSTQTEHIFRVSWIWCCAEYDLPWRPGQIHRSRPADSNVRLSRWFKKHVQCSQCCRIIYVDLCSVLLVAPVLNNDLVFHTR